MDTLGRGCAAAPQTKQANAAFAHGILEWSGAPAALCTAKERHRRKDNCRNDVILHLRRHQGLAAGAKQWPFIEIPHEEETNMTSMEVSDFNEECRIYLT